VNVQEYILSGAIETCVWGLANEQDWKELEQMAELYPEVNAYKQKLELEQELVHLQHAATVPAGTKQAIFAALDNEFKKEEAPVVNLPSVGTNGKPLVVPIVPAPKPIRWLQRAIAVSVILLMGSLILNFYFYSQSVGYRNRYNELFAAQTSLVAKNQALQANFNMLTDTAVKQVVMTGTPKHSQALATVFWDTRTSEVYLKVNALPKPASEKQYQLWAIVNGKPVDAGLLSLDDDGNLVHRMANMPEAQAFAITLEKKGGSPSPTMEALFVVGKV
jgi:hypothetical protein